jgi:hypothetical protein
MSYRNRNRSSTPRTIIAKFAGKCHCCGVEIKAGAMCDYYPSLKAIAHVGGLDGNSARCTAEIRNQRDRGFVDLDRAYEDSCADICGR